MKKVIISAVTLLMGSATVFAQNLNPVIEVTNVYAREATGIEKPSQLLAIPDSVLRFHLDMDYSVNSTPYQGSYEFKPYLVQLKPRLRPSTEGSLFVRAGAGYGLHPEATVVWTPVRKDRFRLNLFGDHASYFGQYHNMALQDRIWNADGTYRSGSRMQTSLGTDALFTWTGGALAADVQYRNIGGTDVVGQERLSNNMFLGRARIKSAPSSKVDYEAGTRIAYIGYGEYLRELHTVSDASLGAHFGIHRMRLGVNLETVSQPEGYAGNVALSPHYLMNLGDFRMDLGVKISFLYRSDENFCPRRSGFFFPDARVTYDALEDVLVLYAMATGGDQIISYDKLLSQNPFMAGTQWHTDNMVTRINTAVGVRGNIRERFHYDLKGGFRWDENAWTWGVVEDYTSPLGYIPSMGYASPLRTFYVMLNTGWKSERIDVEADVYYGYTKIPDLLGQLLFAPAPFKAKGHAFYNWGSRIQAGLTVEARSKLPGPQSIPGYVDLGLQASLRMTRTLGFWLKGGNLLCQSIQRVPLYAEKGLYFTLGATLNL